MSEFYRAALVCALILGGCKTTPSLVWQPVPRELLVADAAAAFRVEGKGSCKALEFPEDRSLFSRPGSEELLLFRIQEGRPEPREFSISKNQLIGDFRSGEVYLVHAPLNLWAKNKYDLFCRLKTVHARLVDRKIIDPLCTRILCPDGPIFADTLLDEFPDLQGFPDEFPRDVLKELELGPLPSEPSSGPGRWGGGFGNPCDQCFERDWEIVEVPFCFEIPEPRPPCWRAAGPGPNTLGQVENIADREVVGAINAVAPHPTDSDIVFVGAVNGGIWKSVTAMNDSPSWIRQTESAESLSIGALEFDPTDASSQTLLAGIGRFSSFFREGGGRTGLLRTTDGGTQWLAIDGGGTLQGLNISGVAPRGSTLVISVNNAPPGNDGIWRSLDTGANWTRVSGATGSGLPAGRAFDLASDLNDPDRLFTDAGGGIFRSLDAGATWTRVSSAAMDALLAGAVNVDMSVGSNDDVYAAIVNLVSPLTEQLTGLFRSGDGGTTWTAMDLPTTANGGLHPGGQGNIHLSIAADRTNANVVYVGGDRQNPPAQGFPAANAIGARDFSGILFRGDASQPTGSQFTPLTHVGTQSNSSPHADSRDMDLAANGVLIEGDDGGIYRRTLPQTSSGDWFSMNGDIQTTEFHSIAWDANSDIIIGGAQDTGTPQQQDSGVVWQSVSTADGGDVAVDEISAPGFSTRYSSNQNLGRFRRRVFDSNNIVQSEVLPARTVLDGGNPLLTQFVTPIAVNNVEGLRLIIGGANSVYESLDEGDTLTEIGPGISINGSGSDPIGYGAAGNPDMLYVGAGTEVFVRTAAAPAALTASAAFPGVLVVDLAIDPSAPDTAFVAGSAQVFLTTDAGTTWTDITGNLGGLATGAICSLVFRSSANEAVVIGTDTGVFFASAPAFDTWNRLGECLPRVQVFDLDYDPTDRVLVAGTLGRGAWILENQ